MARKSKSFKKIGAKIADLPPYRALNLKHKMKINHISTLSVSHRTTSTKQAMSAIFIAVQCFQCSTMQVKQQRSSGNKWICAVCNQKQSVQKVFFGAPMAKDVRKFVQSFNMSRKCADEQMRVDEQDEGITVKNQLNCSAKKKRRSDWSEYLDLDDDRSQNGRGGEQESGADSDFVEEKILTELPEVQTSKSKAMKYQSRPEGDGFSKPIFSKRKHIAKHLRPQDETRNLESAAAIHAPKWSRSDSQDDEKENEKTSLKAKAMAREPSKWSEYITEENYGETRNGENAGATQSGDSLKMMANDEMVEEDIHPDFI